MLTGDSTVSALSSLRIYILTTELSAPCAGLTGAEFALVNSIAVQSSAIRAKGEIPG